jgi:hypothetical protein
VSSREGKLSQEWWPAPVIPTLWRLRQEVLELDCSLGYIARPCLKNRNKRKSILLDHFLLKLEGRLGLMAYVCNPV